MDYQTEMDKNNNLNDTPEIWPGYGVTLVDDLPDPIPLDQLEDQNTLMQIEDMITEIVRTNNNTDAQEFLKRLRLVNELRSNKNGVFIQYQSLMGVLRFLALHTRKEDELVQMFKNELVVALRAGVDVKSRLSLLFLVYDEIVGEGELSRKLIAALSKNTEIIGGISIGNWILDYNRFVNVNLRPGSIIRPGGIDRIGYITKSERAKVLRAEERKIILDLLEIHDWLEFGPVVSEEMRPAFKSSKVIFPLPAPETLTPRVVTPPPVLPKAPTIAPRPEGRGSPQQVGAAVPTLSPIELRDRSTEGHETKTQISNAKLQIKPEIQISRPQSSATADSGFGEQAKIQIPKPQIIIPPPIQNFPNPSLEKRGGAEGMLPPAPLKRRVKSQELRIKAEEIKLPPLKVDSYKLPANPPPAPPPGRIKNQELRIKAEETRPPASGFRPAPAKPQTQSLNESLYKSSLDEIEKMRKEFEKKPPVIAVAKIPPKAPPKANPAPAAFKGTPFSVNEELINAGNVVMSADYGIASDMSPEKKKKESPPEPQSRKPQS